MPSETFPKVDLGVNQFDLIVVGGGAAGFFGAIEVALTKPGSRILILEKSGKVLSKVRISGGGRCNVTHHCFNPVRLASHYPRGEKKLKELFKKFQAKDVVDWFSSKGVRLKAEPDGRMFPESDTSQTIIDCFLKETTRHKIKIELDTAVTQLVLAGNSFQVHCTHQKVYQARKVLIATGGSPKADSYNWLESMGHTIFKPIPSLFTFNDPAKQYVDLMGLSVPAAEVKIATTRFVRTGPVLITHWGLSGPAIIKLSAWAAEYLHQVSYEFTVLVSWIGSMPEEKLRATLLDYKINHPRQKVTSNPLFDLPQRLWQKLCSLAQIESQKTWNDLSLKNINRLIEFLIRAPFPIKGKTTFKEEFVTCGGVDLQDINLETMESKKVKHLFFAGEVLNIDGETGGFNFQAAWTTAFVAARQIATDF